MHTAGVTSGNVHDAKVMDRLIRDDDTAVYGDKGYASDAKKRAAEAAGVLWAVKQKAKPGGRELDVDLRSNIAAEARAKIVYERLINFCDDVGTKDALQFLMTRSVAQVWPPVARRSL